MEKKNQPQVFFFNPDTPLICIPEIIYIFGFGGGDTVSGNSLAIFHDLRFIYSIFYY